MFLIFLSQALIRDIIITRYATLIGCILDSTKPEVLLHGRARCRFGGVAYISQTQPKKNTCYREAVSVPVQKTGQNKHYNG